MSNDRRTVVKIAVAEEGYLEKSAAAYKKDPDIIYEKTKGAGSDNYTKYGKEMHDIYPDVMDFPAYWCDTYVDDCFYNAYGVCNAKKLLGGNFDDYTVNSKALYVGKNAYYTDNPIFGDQIFFTNGKRVHHTGLVYKVDTKYVYTAEGNTSGGSSVVANGGGVALKKYLLTDARIDGYGRPKYDNALYVGAFPTITIKNGVTNKTQVKRLQKFLNWYGNYGLEVDGSCGSLTTEAIRHFQSYEGLTVDGSFGQKSLAKAKTVKR